MITTSGYMYNIVVLWREYLKKWEEVAWISQIQRFFFF